MAQFLIKVPVGGHKQDVTVAAGASIGTDQVRIALDTATVASKAQVLEALRYAIDRLVQSPWPNVS